MGVQKQTMTKSASLGGTFTLLGTSTNLNRHGLCAPCNFAVAARKFLDLRGTWTPQSRFCREAIASGVNHIDTSDYYGPHITNQIIKQALYPYAAGLMIVTKLGARRDADKSWIPALSRQELIDGAHDNLRNLGVDVLDIVNLPSRWIYGTNGRVHRGALDGACRVEARGTDSAYRTQQPSLPDKLTENQRIHPEIVCIQKLLQTWQTAVTMPSIDALAKQATSPTSRFSRWGVHAAAIVDALICDGGVPACNSNAGRARLASAAVSEHSHDSRHFVD